MINLSYSYMEHLGGTKCYRLLTLLDTITGQRVTVFNYGKIGALGQFQTHYEGSKEIYEKKVVEKQRGGYVLRVSEETLIASREELDRVLSSDENKNVLRNFLAAQIAFETFAVTANIPAPIEKAPNDAYLGREDFGAF